MNKIAENKKLSCNGVTVVSGTEQTAKGSHSNDFSIIIAFPFGNSNLFEKNAIILQDLALFYCGNKAIGKPYLV